MNAPLHNLDPRSLKRLAGCHPHLRRVAERASLQIPNPNFRMKISVTCGARTLQEQRHLFAIGASKTMNSRHLIAPNGFSHAVDFAIIDGTTARWDWPLFAKLATIVKHAAELERVPITWGGDWKSFKDGPHFELPWEKYPGEKGT